MAFTESCQSEHSPFPVQRQSGAHNQFAEQTFQTPGTRKLEKSWLYLFPPSNEACERMPTSLSVSAPAYL